MTEMFGEAWSPMSVPDLAPDDDDDDDNSIEKHAVHYIAIITHLALGDFSFWLYPCTYFPMAHIFLDL